VYVLLNLSILCNHC